MENIFKDSVHKMYAVRARWGNWEQTLLVSTAERFKKRVIYVKLPESCCFILLLQLQLVIGVMAC